MPLIVAGLQSSLVGNAQDQITYIVTGKKSTAEELIDKNLGYMQLALTSVSVLDVAGDVTLDSAKTRAMWFIGLGTGGPAVTAGAMLLLYQIASHCSLVLVRCSSSACCLSRQSPCSNDGCSMASAPCSRWRCWLR